MMMGHERVIIKRSQMMAPLERRDPLILGVYHLPLCRAKRIQLQLTALEQN